MDALFHGVQQGIQRYRLPLLRLQRRAHGGKQMGIGGINGGLLREAQSADEGRLQLREEVQRTAQEGHMAPNGLTAGKAGDGLIHHRLENGGSQVRLGGALVDQRLDIGFGKDAAAGRNGIDLLIALGCFVEALRVGLQQGGHLVDEGAGAAGAHAVHPLIQAALEVDDLCVLASQFNGDVCLRRGGFQGGGHSHHLLDELDSKGLSQIDGSGTGNAG